MIFFCLFILPVVMVATANILENKSLTNSKDCAM